MATFKHISSKNADYGDAEKYLTFEHDEFTMKPTLDPEGRLIPREDYRITSLNCGGEDFAVACMRANLRYGKNRQRGDVKSHHFVVASSVSLALPFAAELTHYAAPPLSHKVFDFVETLYCFDPRDVNQRICQEEVPKGAIASLQADRGNRFRRGKASSKKQRPLCCHTWIGQRTPAPGVSTAAPTRP